MPVSDETRRAERDVTGEGKCERFNTFLLLELFVSFRFLHFLHQRQTKATHSHKHSSYTHTHTPIHTWGKRRQNRQTTRKKCRLAQLIKTRNSFSFFCVVVALAFFVFFVFFFASSLLTAVWLKYAWFPKLRLCSAVSSTRYWCCCLYLNVFYSISDFVFVSLFFFLSQVNCTTLSASKATLWRIR